MLIAFLVPAVIATLQSIAGYATRGLLNKEWPYAALQFPRWMVWALVTPLVFAAQRRYPLARPGLGRAMGMHAMLSVVLSVVMEALWLPITLWISARLNPGAPAEAGLAPLLIFAVFGRIIPGALTYAAILGVASTLDSREALRRRDVATSQLEGQLVQSQLAALKMQVHPHFLFNTLHAITVLIREDPAAATRMVARLGDLLRLTMSRAQAQEVTLEAELELVRLYLDIESVRFADRLTVTYDVPREVLQGAVPDLLLQPIVENAIKHGIAPSAGTGQIAVSARQMDRWLEIVVRNSGRTIAAAAARDGVGLSVTRARLSGLYGDAHNLVFAPQPGGGAEVTVRIPWRIHPVSAERTTHA